MIRIHSLPPALRLNSNGHDLAECDVLKLILTGHLDCYGVVYWLFIMEAVNGKSRGGDADTFVSVLNSRLSRSSKPKTVPTAISSSRDRLTSIPTKPTPYLIRQGSRTGEKVRKPNRATSKK